MFFWLAELALLWGVTRQAKRLWRSLKRIFCNYLETNLLYDCYFPFLKSSCWSKAILEQTWKSYQDSDFSKNFYNFQNLKYKNDSSISAVLKSNESFAKNLQDTALFVIVFLWKMLYGSLKDQVCLWQLRISKNRFAKIR